MPTYSVTHSGWGSWTGSPDRRPSPKVLMPVRTGQPLPGVKLACLMPQPVEQIIRIGSDRADAGPADVSAGALLDPGRPFVDAEGPARGPRSFDQVRGRSGRHVGDQRLR